jgi:quinoprotein glucose dehydrogenase
MRSLFGFSLVVLVVTAEAAPSDHRAAGAEWPYYGGDAGYSKYSPLDQISAANVKNLRVAWRHPALPPDVVRTYPDLVKELPGRERHLFFENSSNESRNNFQSTPLMIDGTLYALNQAGLVEAIEPSTGKTLWIQEPPEPGEAGYTYRQRMRGLAYWGSGADARTFSVRGRYLFALDAKTGKARQDFGDHGKVDLTEGFRLPARGYSWPGVPLVVRDVVVVAGHGTTDVRQAADSHEGGPGGADQRDLPRMLGDIRAYDVRTGRLRWTFRTIPGPGEFGNETWQQDSWKRIGGADSWTSMSADPDLGYIYVPLDAPEYDWYGGERPGNNLFADSLVCLDAQTGKRVWYYQLVHHNLWDYESPAAPLLANITVNGRDIKAVVEITKMGFSFVFDRVTGVPVWPIEERSVPKGNVPGEWYSPTQPFPTKPAPFEHQGLTQDDLINFTPELRAEAQGIAKQYVFGPLYTPPSIKSDEPGGTKGTLMIPSWIGGGNWDGAAFDPATHLMYVPSMSGVFLIGLKKSDSKSKYAYEIDGTSDVLGPRGLPLTKPPYGHITAIDLNRGEHVWETPIGDGPRHHPLLEHLNLPPLGTQGRRSPLLTKTLLFLGEGDPSAEKIPYGGGGKMFRAFDKASGKVLWETELPAGTTGAPMTYLASGKQYIVVAVGGLNHPAEFVAYSLP